MNELIITPKTKVAEMLDAYPQLEDALIDIAPQFKKLKNPVLRKTIARVTTLGQAAIVGGVKVEEMVSKLREIIGQNNTTSIETENTTYNTEKPQWFKESLIAQTIDTREMLNAGEHPVHEVLSSIKKLNDSEILKIITPFIPAPLIDKTISLKYKHWLVEQSTDEYILYFTK
ncbi:MAG: hypothetical protein C0598_03450 [Marinilabiliales bacterium]|nr:MAG: hypothetical protein C0598_03450 [Marinilabiliales bacterium]